jgi:transketolase
MPYDVRWCIQHLLQMHHRAQVGHLGGNLSCVTALHAVFAQMHADDRFVLSKGHSAGALYTVLAAYGHIPVAELETFHQDGTRLPGHPPVGKLAHVPFATGSLGHGLSLAVGFALSARLRESAQRVWCLTSDGEWQEGSTWEALIFAVHQRLTNLTIFIDCNGWQGFGSTQEVASQADFVQRLTGFDVDISQVDGHDWDDIMAHIPQTHERVHVVLLQTIKGYGVPAFADTLQSHYLPITTEQYQQAIDRMHADEK